jgi:hypothetical protein
LEIAEELRQFSKYRCGSLGHDSTIFICQSSLTGYSALFLVRWINRAFVETIDGVSRARKLPTTGADYFSIIFQSVIPSTLPQ